MTGWTHSDHGGQGRAALIFVVSIERSYRKWQVHGVFFFFFFLQFRDEQITQHKHCAV